MRDDLDRLIDEGLAAYGNVDPMAGLDQRVLGRVRSSRRRRWMWAAAIPAFAAAAWVVVVVRQPAPVPPPVVALAAPPAPEVAPIERKARPVTKVRRKAPEVPKRPLFPTPTTLTTEERMLVALATSHPEELRPVALPDKIDIKPIEIAPLDVRGPQ